VLAEIVDLYRSLKDKFRSAKISKQELLVLFSQIGSICPSLYEATYSQQGKIDSFKRQFLASPRIQKRYLKD